MKVLLICGLFVTIFGALAQLGPQHPEKIEVSTPTFTLLHADRSINESPKIHVVFQNGETDTMILSTPKQDRDHRDSDKELEGSDELEDSNKLDDSEEKLEDSKQCLYFGHLENEPNTCVAVSGCPGYEDVEMTILSKNIQKTPAFLWTKDGSVKNIFFEGESKVVKSKDEINGNQTDYDDFNSDQSNENLQPNFDHRSIAEMRRGNPPPGMVLNLQVGYGRNFKTKVPSHTQRKRYINAGIHHAQAYFCHNSLGSKIELKVHSIKSYSKYEFYTRKNFNSPSNIGSLTKKKLKDGMDLLVFVGHDTSTTDNTKGTAPLGSVCASQNSIKWSINEWSPYVADFGFIVAHEIGHNFGMEHDFEENGKFYDESCNCQGIESYQGQNGCPYYLPAAWSSCSKKYFIDHYKTVTNWCLQSKTISVCNHRVQCDMSTFNDGICDDKNNIEACAFDGGDCCDRRNSNWNSRCKQNNGDCNCKDNTCYDSADWCNERDPNFVCTSRCFLQTPEKPPCWTYCKRVCNKCNPSNTGHPHFHTSEICNWVKLNEMCDQIDPEMCGKESCGDLCKETCA